MEIETTETIQLQEAPKLQEAETDDFLDRPHCPCGAFVFKHRSGYQEKCFKCLVADNKVKRKLARPKQLARRYKICGDCGEPMGPVRSGTCAKRCKDCAEKLTIKQRKEYAAKLSKSNRTISREDWQLDIEDRKQTIVELVELMGKVHSPILFEKFSEKHKQTQRSFRNYAIQLCEEGRIQKEGFRTGRYYSPIATATAEGYK